MIHQSTLDHLVIVLGIAVVLAGCSTVPGPLGVGNRLRNVPASTEQKRDSDFAPAETESRRRQRIVEIARKYLGIPYRWGGTNPSGFDCSGLVRYVYAQVGVSLPHNAAKQYRYGVSVSRDRLEPGDVVFFDRLRHSGIYIGDGRLIDARQSGKRVSIASLDDNWYAEHWVGARRL